MRIAVASFSHETCTFNPTPTTVEDFEWGGVPRGQAVIDGARGVSTYLNGFIKVADASPDVELVGILDASSPQTVLLVTRNVLILTATASPR